MIRVRTTGGFTLIEVLTALAMLAVILPVVMSGISLASSLGTQARQRALAATLAAAKLDELVTVQAWQSGAMSGDFAPDHTEFRWQASLVDFDGSALQQLVVQVTWTSRQGQRSLSLGTLVNTEAL